MSGIHMVLTKLPEWPLVTQRTAREREQNAFSIGVDAGRAIGERPVSAHLDTSARHRQGRP